jgi:signal peptidase I
LITGDKVLKKKKHLEFILDTFLLAVFIGLFFPAAVMLDSVLRDYIPFLDTGFDLRMTTGTSMLTTINDLDIVFIQKHPKDIKVGDIISFELDGFPTRIMHRVIDIQEEPILTFKTKGDNNGEPDRGRITMDQVRGRAILIISASFLITPHMLYTPIILSAICVLLKIVYWLSRKNTIPRFSLDITTALLILILVASCAKLVVVMHYKNFC